MAAIAIDLSKISAAGYIAADGYHAGATVPSGTTSYGKVETTADGKYTLTLTANNADGFTVTGATSACTVSVDTAVKGGVSVAGTGAKVIAGNAVGGERPTATLGSSDASATVMDCVLSVEGAGSTLTNIVNANSENITATLTKGATATTTDGGVKTTGTVTLTSNHLTDVEYEVKSGSAAATAKLVQSGIAFSGADGTVTTTYTKNEKKVSKKTAISSGATVTIDTSGATGLALDTVTAYTDATNDDHEIEITSAGSATFGRGDDKVGISADSVTADAGDGDNQVQTTKNANGVSVKTGKGDDGITLTGDYENASAGAGDDTVVVTGHDATVDAGAGDDSITVTGDYASISSGDGHDSILAAGDYATIDAGAGHNNIDASYKYATVTFGDGQNTVAAGSNATITGGNGNDSIHGVGHNSSVTLGDGRDTVEGAGNDIMVALGNGDDVVTIAGNSAAITTGAGRDSIYVSGEYATINSGAGRDTISLGVGSYDAVITTGDGDKYIDGDEGDGSTITSGAGNDTIVTAGSDVVNAGAGNDSIIAASNTTITAGLGKDTISAKAGRTGIVFTDYELGTDTIYLADTDNLTKDHFTTDGKITTSGTTPSDITISSLAGGYYAVQLTEKGASDGKDTVSSYAWAGEAAAQIDGSEATTGFTIFGDTNTEGDGILGTKHDDVINAGIDDSIIAGKGKDTINVQSAERVWVGLRAGDNDETVTGAVTGYSDEATTFAIDTTDGLKMTNATSTANAKIALKGASMSLTNGSTTNTQLKMSYGGTTYNTQIVTGSQLLDDETQVVFGDRNKKSGNGIRLTNGEGTTVDLSNAKKLGDTRVYDNIQIVDASADTGDDILMGGTAAATLMGGQGTTSLWGGSAKGDLLIGGSGENTFFYGAGDGKDTVTGYTAETDKLYLTDSDLQSVTRTKDGLVLKYAAVDGKTQKLTVQNDDTNKSNAADDKYIITTDGTDQWTAKVGMKDSANSFTYEDDVNFYVGGTKADTLTVDDSADSANIWLNGYSYGGQKAYSDIKTVNAGTSTADVTLVGADGKDNVLVASKGSSSLWGGYGSTGDDLLDATTAGRSDVTFFFGKGNGKDTIQGAGEDDRVMLYDVTLDDIDFSKSSTKSGLKLALTDGSSVTLTGINGTTNLVLSDGSTYTYNAKTKSFE